MINIYGAIMLVLLMLPNIAYLQKIKLNGKENVRRRGSYSSVEIVEQIGRYGSIIFMLVNTGFGEQGFASDTARLVWIITAAIFMIGYYIFWAMLFKKPSDKFCKIMLAVLPSILFVFSGIIMIRPASIFFGAVFAASHIYITYTESNKQP